ncbi:transporter substrate-binding domain-containing protein [Acidaminobacter sp. JC074]|uniref:transporter substrate-binding domain-containing protein n=1 Tax=Acidaminobacter sp. JC074 TaxID=2530199 RepID=UPI001F0FFEBC|nr:transporter substrate-binding domain-containing protein [Acidaminobacter sp. JC074]
MKKFVVLILLSLLLVACQSDDESLRVGMDLRFYPFTGMDAEGNPSGVEVDISKALGDYLGRNVEIVNTEFPMLIPALQSGEIDIVIGSMSVTEEREKTVDFSKPYMYDKIVALVNKDFAENNEVSDEMSVDSFFSLLNARFIGITGSIAVSIPQSYGYEVQAVTSDAVAEREIATGGADVLVGAYTLYGMHDTNKETTLMYKNAIELSDIAMAVKEGNRDLLDQVNDFIDTMEDSGLTDQLKSDWNEEIGKKLFDASMTLDYYLNK